MLIYSTNRSTHAYFDKEFKLLFSSNSMFNFKMSTLSFDLVRGKESNHQVQIYHKWVIVIIYLPYTFFSNLIPISYECFGRMETTVCYYNMFSKYIFSQHLSQLFQNQITLFGVIFARLFFPRSTFPELFFFSVPLSCH